MSVDPRLAERRRQVAEDRAKRNVRRLLKFFAVVAMLGGVVWFALSPWMSISQVRITGANASEVDRILEAHRFVPGTPMVLLRPGPAVEALKLDPWVRDAEIRLNWPDDVVVRIEERLPRAWVETGGGWARRSEDGYPVPSAARPDGSLGSASFPFLAEEDAIGSELVLGAVEFLMALTPELAAGTSVWFEEGEMWSEVDGYRVRLGRAIQMREKAISLMGLLGEGPPTGSVLILIAPSNPAVVQPEGPQPGDGDDDDTGDPGEAP